MKLEITEEKFAELAKEHGYIKFEPSTTELKVKPKFGRVKPDVGDKHWAVNMNGYVQKTTYRNDSLDADRWAMGNVYLTRESAELARDRQQAKVRVIYKLAELRTEELDWGNFNQQKFQLIINVNGECSFISAILCLCVEKELRSTKEACEWVAENMADDVRLYLTGE